MENRKETKIEKLVGRIGNDYYFCDDLFEYTDSFKGATGSVMTPVSKEDYDERTSDESLRDSYKYIWVETVKAGNTEESFTDWLEDVKDNDGDEAFFDLGEYQYAEALRKLIPELTEEDYPVIENTGAGRIFDTDLKFDEIYDQELLTKILEQESNK